MIFLKQLISSAKHTGAIAPSSPFLAKKMIAVANVKSAQTIVELGPGSGAITKEILKSMPSKAKLWTFDINQQFVTFLKEKYPQGNHIHADVADFKSILKQEETRHIDVIISGIPFVDFTKAECDVMLGEIASVMSTHSLFVLFTYTPIRFKTFFKWFDKVSLDYVPLNIPPAYVLVLQKK